MLEANVCKLNVTRFPYEIARLAVGGVLNAVDAVMTGEVDNAFAFVRPPGHHAGAGNSEGF